MNRWSFELFLAYQEKTSPKYLLIHMIESPKLLLLLFRFSNFRKFALCVPLKGVSFQQSEVLFSPSFSSPTCKIPLLCFLNFFVHSLISLLPFSCPLLQEISHSTVFNVCFCLHVSRMLFYLYVIAYCYFVCIYFHQFF